MGVSEHSDVGESWLAKARAGSAPADLVDSPGKGLELTGGDSLGKESQRDKLTSEVPELSVEGLQHLPDPREAVVAVHLGEEGQVGNSGLSGERGLEPGLGIEEHNKFCDVFALNLLFSSHGEHCATDVHL